MYYRVLLLLQTLSSVLESSALHCKHYTDPLDSICGCFTSRSATLASGFYVGIDFEPKFWKATSEVHATDVQFELEIKNSSDEYHELQKMTCVQNARNCSAYYNFSLQHDVLYTITIFLSCEPSALCEDCDLLEETIVKKPETIFPPPTTTKRMDELPKDTTLLLILIPAILTLAVAFLVTTLLIIRRSQRHRRPYPPPSLTNQTTGPLIPTDQPMDSEKRILIVTQPGNDSKSVNVLVDILNKFDNLSVNYFNNELNVHQWIDAETRTFDIVIVILSSVSEVVNTDHPMTNTVDYWLQRVSHRTEEHNCQCYLVQFDLQLDLSNFKSKYPCLPYYTIFTFTDIASLTEDSATCRNLKQLLLAIMGESKRTDINSAILQYC